MKASALAVCALMVGAAFGAIGAAAGLDPSDPKDALLDYDGDGLSNLQEYLMGCDPYDPDSDGDLLPDGWEGYYRENPALYDYDGDGTPDRTFVVDVIAGYRFDPANPLDAFSDPDDDGLTNLAEYRLGTDPSNPNTDWDRFVKDSEDPEPLVQDAEYKAVFGGSISHPYAGPLAYGRSVPAEQEGTPAGGRAASPPDEGGAGGRALKYITRVIVDSALPSSVVKGQPFTISGHVEATAVQIDDGSDTGGNGQQNGPGGGQNGQGQQPGSNPGNPDPNQGGQGGHGQDQGQGQGQGQSQGQGQGQGQGQSAGQGNGQGHGQGNGYGNGGSGNSNGQGNGYGQGSGDCHGQGNGQGHGQNNGQGQGTGEGGQNGQGHGTGGGDKPLFYWYWWHGPQSEGGRSAGRASSEWYPIDQPMDIAIQLNTSKGSYAIGSGKAALEVDGEYGHFEITCIIPGAAPGGEGKVAIHSLANSNFAGSWWEEGRD